MPTSAREDFIGNVVFCFMNDRWKVVFEEKSALAFKIINIFFRQVDCDFPVLPPNPTSTLETVKSSALQECSQLIPFSPRDLDSAVFQLSIYQVLDILIR